MAKSNVLVEVKLADIDRAVLSDLLKSNDAMRAGLQIALSEINRIGERCHVLAGECESLRKTLEELSLAESLGFTEASGAAPILSSAQ